MQSDSGAKDPKECTIFSGTSREDTVHSQVAFLWIDPIEMSPIVAVEVRRPSNLGDSAATMKPQKTQAINTRKIARDMIRAVCLAAAVAELLKATIAIMR